MDLLNALILGSALHLFQRRNESMRDFLRQSRASWDVEERRFVAEVLNRPEEVRSYAEVLAEGREFATT